MDNGIVIPSALVFTLMLATLTQLEDVAQQTTDKVAKYADDQKNAVDCAFQARMLTECSPDLFATDFHAEAQETQRILDDLKASQPGARLQRG
jgi:hypothetical protein